MTFDYSIYFVSCFFIPLIVTVTSAVLFVSCVFDLIKSTSFKDIMKFAFFVTITLSLLIINIGRLAFGGWHLIYEKEEHATNVVGIVSGITCLKRNQFPELTDEPESNHNSGYLIIVNNTPVVSPNRGNIEVGDFVSVTYLPKCRYVLQIDKTDR